MHHGPITCVCLAAPFPNGYCAESLKGLWCGQRNTALSPVQTLSNTRGVICLNPSAKRLPVMLDELRQTSKQIRNLKFQNLWSGVHTAGQASRKKEKCCGSLKQTGPPQSQLISPDEPSQRTCTHRRSLHWKCGTSLCDDTCGSE